MNPANTSLLGQRAKLLTAASVLAMTLAASGPARADLADRPTWIFVEGAIDFLVDGDDQGWAETGTNAITANLSRDTVGPTDGWHGALGFVTPLGDTPYDLEIAVRYGETGKSSEDDDFAYAVNGIGGVVNFGSAPRDTVSHEEEHLIVDFAARRDLGVGQDGGTRVTGIAGIRFAHFDAQTDSLHQSGAFFYSIKRTSRFYGAGPTVGLETVTPLSDTVSFDFGADAALLLGDMHRKVSLASSVPVNLSRPFDTDSHHFRAVPTLGATAAFSFMPSGMGGMKISLGVTADAWFGAYDQKVDRPFPGSQDANDDGEKNADRYNVGGFLRLVFPFGG